MAEKPENTNPKTGTIKKSVPSKTASFSERSSFTRRTNNTTSAGIAKAETEIVVSDAV